MNWRRGLLRVWLVGSCIWVAFAFVKTDATYRIGYAYRYAFQYESLSSPEEARQACAYDRLLSKPSEHSMSPLDRSMQAFRSEAECVASFRPSDPSWSWLGIVLLPPTLGVTIAVIIFVMALRLFEWIWRGFKQP